MTIDADDEILQDFLVEAGEILEQLGAQLVDLEQRPDDLDLLNAVFRGFHTIKGGAGFLNIESLVEVCHRAEDVFNVLRQGQRTVDAGLMDAVLQVLDVVNEMFGRVRGGEEPRPAGRSLISRLEALAQPGEAAPTPSEVRRPTAGSERDPVSDPVSQEMDALLQSAQASMAAAEASDGDGLSDAELDALLDHLHGEVVQGGGSPKGLPAAVPGPASAEAQGLVGGDEITETEFEALLDQLHGKGRHGGVPGGAEVEAAAAPTPVPAASDEITEVEFEALLDQLHGKGRHGGLPGEGAAVPAAGPQVTPPTAAAPPPMARPPVAPQAAAPVVTSPVARSGAPVPRPSTPRGEPDPEVDETPAPVAGRVKPVAETTVRVDTQRLDDIMNMVGELVLVRNRLSTLKATTDDEDLANAVANLDVVTADLQVAVMKTRMQPIKKVFGRFPRVVRDLARSLRKEVDLEMQGEETDLDKNLVEALADPLIHLVRNAVDHGIEMPAERERAGKPRKGRVMLAAAQEGDHILLSIEDDGKGMDPEVLRVKAVEKGLMDAEAAARLDEKELFSLIFAPGFSTKSEISDVSGRGVGMDVVKTRIAQMNGLVEVHSRLGRGSRIVIKLPLTLAIMPTLMVVLGKQPFALPLASVVEIFNLDLKRTHTVDGQLTVRLRDRALPLFYLRKWLVRDQPGESDCRTQTGHVVVVNVGSVQVGLVVDYLIGQEEVVIKPLGALLQGLQGMAGATITGDGKIALILDVPGLMRKYARRY
jgi:two-component system, chemotaxis family, sensor kinase CheA